MGSYRRLKDRLIKSLRATGLAGLQAQKATTTIPIVVIASHDGVSLGLYQGIARPGGNITGIDSLSEALDAKPIELLR